MILLMLLIVNNKLVTLLLFNKIKLDNINCIKKILSIKIKFSIVIKWLKIIKFKYI